ncbi:baseplate J/gp47 family protein [Escherichia coli]|nr:baseplate assembly protein [Escherichia coli]EFC3514912.1 baseplate assembly protein [Escherichia coli]EFJ2154704.1 baseplate assembly protein [Escherichia coli]EGK4623580.1 baseplate assembly protein [Escherichia coli]EGK4668543.1 baseplate assembly protein [Escherichia coli]
MMAYVDLSQLSQPDIINIPDFEDELESTKAVIIAAFPPQQREAIASALDIESEPLCALAQAFTYRIILILQRINEAVRAVLLSSANNSDLDSVAANFDVKRLIITEATETEDAVMESDEDLRARVLLAWARLSTAGAKNAYHYFSRSADADVLDVRAYGPETHSQEGRIFLYVLSRSGNGEAQEALLNKVAEAVNDDETRPLTDFVSVRSAEIVPYTIRADVHIPYGLDVEVVLNQAKEALYNYTTETHRIHATVACSGIDRALHQTGVVTVKLHTPETDLVTEMGQAPWCTDVKINPVVIDNDQ